MSPRTVVDKLVAFLNKYLVFANSEYPLPIALWVLGTYLHLDFDSYPYLYITASTKRAGKTRLLELIKFTASNPEQVAALTAATVFRSIKDVHPTLLFDESEKLKTESASDVRGVINVGYRKGAIVKRVGKGGIEEFDTYGPKAFVQIGDAFDTLRDRSIIIRMRRASIEESAGLARFLYTQATAEGAEIAEAWQEVLETEKATVLAKYLDSRGLPFLNDRDEEIWTPLFALCEAIAPQYVERLKRVAADMATEKTHDAVRAVDLLGKEEVAQQEEYTHRLLTDMVEVMKGRANMFSKDIIKALRDLPTGPWRRFRTDEGLTEIGMADMLARFPGCTPRPIRVGSSKSKESKVARGYRTEDVKRALKHLVEHGLSE